MKNFNYGETLRITRKAKGVNQESMATNLTISQASYSRMESGKIIPDRQQAAIINKILGIPLLDPKPLLEELNHDTIVSTSGTGFRQTAVLLGKPAAFIIKIGLALALGGVAYDAARGACSALETSANTASFASWIAALTMVAYFYYWARGIKKIS
jgi:transcriptional regulator with XRE-family HTH domain